MTQIRRVASFSEFPLAADLDERVIVVVGWMKGELLPPHPRGWREKVDRVHRYIRGTRARKVPGSLGATDIRRRFGEAPPLVEIVGALANHCVLVTAHYFLEAGSQVYIDPELTIHPNPRLPPYWVGRTILQDLLSSDRSRRCAIYRGNFLFYGPRG